MKRLIMKQLIAWKDEKGRKPLLLMGVRQVGKTYILQEFARNHFPRAHYINFEKEPGLSKIFEPNLKPQRIVEELSIHLNQSIDTKQDIVIFDEIQACPLALTSLKYFQEELAELSICGAGSLLGVHLTPVSFPVGKVTILTLNPMSFEEFLLADDEQRSLNALRKLKNGEPTSQFVHELLWSQLKRYFVVGGMPEIVATYCAKKDHLLSALTAVREMQDQLVRAYYADMAKHSGKVNSMHIDRVFRSIPSQLERLHDDSVNKFKFKGVIPGVSHYARIAGAIDWLIAAGLAIKVHVVNSGQLPFKSHSRENIFKLYLFDIGILGAMSGLSPKMIMDYDYGSYKGYFAENYVAQAFICSGEKDLFCWHEKTAEVEFLREVDGKVIPVEVKSGMVSKAKSLKVFSEKYKPIYRVLMSGSPLHIDAEHGFHRYPLYLADSFPLSYELA